MDNKNEIYGREKMADDLFLQQKGKNIISVSSGRRGSGKTWFSITLAHALSLLKQRILFFDADIGLGNICNQLGLSVNGSIDNVIDGKQTLNQIVTHCDKTKFDVISASSKELKISSIPIGYLQILGEDLSIMSSSYGKIIIDTNDCTNKNDRVLTSIAKRAIIICTANPDSITEAYNLIKIVSLQCPKNMINIVVNMVNTISEGKRVYSTLLAACQNNLNIKPDLLGVVRRDTRVRDAIRNQTSMITRYPTSEAVEDVYTIAKKILKEDYERQ